MASVRAAQLLRHRHKTALAPQLPAPWGPSSFSPRFTVQRRSVTWRRGAELFRLCPGLRPPQRPRGSSAAVGAEGRGRGASAGGLAADSASLPAQQALPSPGSQPGRARQAGSTGVWRGAESQDPGTAGREPQAARPAPSPTPCGRGQLAGKRGGGQPSPATPTPTTRTQTAWGIEAPNRNRPPHLGPNAQGTLIVKPAEGERARSVHVTTWLALAP